MTIKAHFDGRVLIPDEPLGLAVNQQVTLQVEPAGVPTVHTEKEMLELFAEMDADAVQAGDGIDYSRDSIYGGTIDDPR
jgi:hypothetical protein